MALQNEQAGPPPTPIRIESIADHLDLIPALARWHWEEWGDSDPGGSLASWTARLGEFTRPEEIPTVYVALEGDELLGSVTLNEQDMSTRPDLTPWLSGMYVKPEARGRGVASALVWHAVRAAGHMGVDRLYLYTHSARGLYEKLGWRELAQEFYEKHVVTIMVIEPNH